MASITDFLTADRITAAGTLLGGIGALVAGIAACRALNTWRANLKGEARFDVAKRLLSAAHDFAEKFHGARSRGILEPELTDVLSNPQASASQRADAYEHAFDARWEPVRAAGANMLVLMPEARAMLPAGTAEAAEALLELANRLRAAMQTYASYVRDYGMGGSDPDQHPKIDAEWLRVRKEVHSSHPRRTPEPDNPLTQDFVKRYTALLELLKPLVERPG